MKNQLFLLFVLTFYCIGFISCQEKSDKKDKRKIFLENSQATETSDSLSNDEEISFELNFESDPERGQWQNPDLVIKKFGSLSGKTVADIGSGTGYFTLPLSELARKVIAIDIEQRYLDYIEDFKLEIPIEQADAIETRLTMEDEPNLHADEVDAVLMVNVFYYLKNRTDYMRIVKDAIRPKGMLVLVDFKPGDLPVGPAKDKVPADTVVNILKEAGFNAVEVDDESLRYQYIITAK